MKDKPHDEALAGVYRNDPEEAAAVLAAVEADGDPAELAIVRRQLAAGSRLPLLSDASGDRGARPRHGPVHRVGTSGAETPASRGAFGQ